MITQVLLLGLGLAFMVRPQWFAGISEARRQHRLTALNAGATEEFFEEKRALQAYPARHSGLNLTRLLGAVMVLSMLALLLLPL